MEIEPIKSQYEANKAFTFLVDTTIKVTNCDKEQALKRVVALFESGILNNPADPDIQKNIDEFMFTPIN